MSERKKRPVLMLIFSTVSKKIIDNKGVCSSNKMWSLKNLTKLKCKSRTVCMLYNISNSQALF